MVTFRNFSEDQVGFCHHSPMIFPWIAHGCLIKAPFLQLPTILHLRRGRISRCSPQLRRQGKLWTLMRHVAENLPEVSQVGNVQRKHRKHHVFDLPKVRHVRETPWILDVHILVGLGGKFCWKAWSLPRRLRFPGDFFWADSWNLLWWDLRRRKTWLVGGLPWL